VLKNSKFAGRKNSVGDRCLGENHSASSTKAIQAIYKDLSDEGQSSLRPWNINSPERLTIVPARREGAFTTEGHKPSVDNLSVNCQSNGLSVPSSSMRPINLGTRAPNRIAKTVQLRWLKALARMLVATRSVPGWLRSMVPAGMEAI